MFTWAHGSYLVPEGSSLEAPVHASWLNQIEIYFSIVERKVLTPNDFSSLREVQDRLLRFQAYYETIARPFEWNSLARTWMK